MLGPGVGVSVTGLNPHKPTAAPSPAPHTSPCAPSPAPQVFLQKSAVNLLHSVLDTPEFFWHAPDTYQVKPTRGGLGRGTASPPPCPALPSPPSHPPCPALPCPAPPR